MSIRIARTTEADWVRVRDVRLRALAESPQAFGSTYEREVAFDEAEWRHRAAGHWWLAVSGEQVVGVIASYNEDPASSEKYVVSMWVDPTHRGQSVGAQLLEALCAWAKADGAEAVTLQVNDSAPGARRFYERLGFAPTGVRQSCRGDGLADADLMRRTLPRSP